MNNQATRKCKKCDVFKDIEQFPVHTKATGARRHECCECNKARVEAHHVANKAHRLERARGRYAKDPSAHWTPERKERAKELMKVRGAELRDQVYKGYGGKCKCCGEDNPLFLTLDHVANDGASTRKSQGSAGANMYRWVIKNSFPPNLQLYCMNCNFGKARNGGVCPHEERSTAIPKGSTPKRGEAQSTRNSG